MANQRLTDKSCVVSGAARGIGTAIAKRLAAEGASVGVVDVDIDGAQGVADEITGQGGKAIACRCDVSARADVKAMVHQVVDTFGSLDVIFNNAAVAEIRLFMDVEEEHWNRIMKVNGLGVLICMQEAARQMIDQGQGGKIINTASIAGKEGYDLQPHYCASKFAVVALTQAGARAFGQHGITVNAFCPGVVRTELWKQLDQEFIELGISERPGQAMDDFASRALLGRSSTPDDIVGLAAFLASNDSNYITGQSIMVDGGMVLS